MLYSAAKWLLEHMDPARANRVMIDNLEWFTTLGFHDGVSRMPDEDPLEVMGLRFPNAVGLAAGLDRNGAQVCSFGAFGFGFVEAGTITLAEQKFVSSPAFVRDNKNKSIVIHDDFENAGAQTALKALRSADGFLLRGGVTGISIGASRTSAHEDIALELEELLSVFYRRADYFSLNLFCSKLSDPAEVFKNTSLLQSIVSACCAKRDALAEALSLPRRPITLKLPASLSDDDLLRCADICVENGINAVTAAAPLAAAGSGRHTFVCGAPLRERSSSIVSLLSSHLQGALPVIATGGVLTKEDAAEKIKAGAALVQILTGFVFNGPGFVADCVEAVAQARRVLHAQAAQ